MTLSLRSAACVAVLLAAPLALQAQGNRAAQIAQAARSYADFDAPAALRILRVALDPAAGPTDSVWGSGVQLLAQILIEDNRAALAGTWLRWAFRQNPAMRIDSVTYLPTVVAAAKTALTATRGGSPGDGVTTTRFTWPAAGSADTVGWFRTPTSANPVVRVLIEGVGILGANQNLALAPGTYNIQATADGYVTARTSREILPGTVTNLSFALRSTAIVAADTTLTATTRGRAERALVRLTVRRFGSEPSCVAGAFVSGNGLVLTTYQAIRGADAIEAESTDGTPVRTGITVAAYDARRNIAVLKLPVTRTDSLVPTQTADDGQFGWGLGFAPCATAAVSRTRIASWTDRPNGILQLSDSLANAGQGGPIIDRGGSLFALGAGARAAVPGLHALELLVQARRNVAAGPLATIADVSRRENHLFGSLLIRTTVTGGVLRVNPQETWQWPELSRQGPSPFTFSGPVGRYQIQVLVGGQVRQEATATVVAGVQTPVTLQAQVAQGPAGQPSGPAAAPRKKGKSPLPFILIGVGGAGAAAFLVMGKKSGPVDPGPGTSDFGSITITIPNN